MIYHSMRTPLFLAGDLMEQLTKMYFTSPESCVYGAVTHVSSMLTAAALTCQSAFDEVD